MYPSVPLMGRMLAEELTLGKWKNGTSLFVFITRKLSFRSGEYTFPKGASVAITPVRLGRNPRLFKDPLEFRPERFLEDTSSEKFIFSYLPFSAGPRNCKLIC